MVLGVVFGLLRVSTLGHPIRVWYGDSNFGADVAMQQVNSDLGLGTTEHCVVPSHINLYDLQLFSFFISHLLACCQSGICSNLYVIATTVGVIMALDL